ncbi:MAG TPA: hypothetical protein VFB82_04415 [Blastocatellia bacterium]|nr:hypothetical protein [Blastocatellia bacterium]
MENRSEYEGKVVNGVVVLENGDSLPEGTRVRVSTVEPASTGETLGQRLLKFAGTAKGLPSDMAENHDHYIHGRPKK